MKNFLQKGKEFITKEIEQTIFTKRQKSKSDFLGDLNVWDITEHRAIYLAFTKEEKEVTNLPQGSRKKNIFSQWPGH